MAYIDKTDVKAIRNKLKTKFPDCVFSVKKVRNSSVSVSLLSSNIDFYDGSLDRTNGVGEKVEFNGLSSIVQYHTSDYPQHQKFFDEVFEVIKKAPTNAGGANDKSGWYDKSDHSSDYFDVAYYINFFVGGDKKYVCNNENQKTR